MVIVCSLQMKHEIDNGSGNNIVIMFDTEKVMIIIQNSDSDTLIVLSYSSLPL